MIEQSVPEIPNFEQVLGFSKLSEHGTLVEGTHSGNVEMDYLDQYCMYMAEDAQSGSDGLFDLHIKLPEMGWWPIASDMHSGDMLRLIQSEITRIGQ